MLIRSFLVTFVLFFCIDSFAKKTIILNFPQLDDQTMSLRLKRSIIAEVLHRDLELHLKGSSSAYSKKSYDFDLTSQKAKDVNYWGFVKLNTPSGKTIEKKSQKALNPYQLNEFFITSVKSFLEKIDSGKI